MDIKEVVSSEVELDYKFTHVPFSGFSDNLKANFVKWGLINTFKVEFFRFNIAFSDLSSNKFFGNMFNSAEVKAKLVGLFPNKKVSEFKVNKLKCTMVNMNFLDHLQENGKSKSSNPRFPHST